MKTLTDVQPGGFVVLHKVDGTTRLLEVMSVTKTTITTKSRVWSKKTGRRRGADPRWEPEWIEAINVRE